MQTLIALNSPAMGSGKSTVAQHLVNRHGFEHLAFATPLKRMTARMLEMLDLPAAEIRERVWGDRKEDDIPGWWDVKSRHHDFAVAMAQIFREEVWTPYTVWTDVLPHLNIDTWEFVGLLDAFLRTLPITMTSRRFQQLLGTEFGRQMIKDSLWVDITMGKAARLRGTGKSVVIDDMRFPNEFQAVLARWGTPVRLLRPGIEVTAAHSSEGQLDGYDMRTIVNDGTIADLMVKTDALVEECRALP